MLLRKIAGEIREAGPIPFARFMDIALNDPETGYYAAGATRLGAAGDFFTASDLGPTFGRCVARQIAEMDEMLDRPRPFRYLEVGAGRGLLARDVARTLSGSATDLHGRIRFDLVDASPAMREAARAALPEAHVLGPPGPSDALPGCGLAVELFDALPVHRLRRRDGRLVEVFVTLDDGGRLVETEGEPTPLAAGWAERYGAASREGEEAEVAPSLPAALEALQRPIDRGFVVVVDYGDEASRLYGPGRPRGTLLAYRRHHTSEDVLDRVGEQDLTAHVNLSALVDAAGDLGLRHLGTTTQDRFLIGNGLLDVFESGDEEDRRRPARVRERLQAMRLIHPHGMGRVFSVVVFAKGIEPTRALAGLADPFAP